MNLTAKQIALLALAFFFAQALFSQASTTYYSIGAGSWTATSGVWSTDGANPCGCAPGLTTLNENLIIRHAISMPAAVSLSNGDSLTLSAAGSLSGAGLTVTGYIDNYGDLSPSSLDITLGGQIWHYGNGTIAGNANVDGTFFIFADISFSGNVSNNGFMFILPGSAVTIEGDFSNSSSVFQEGSNACILVTGNMTNTSVGMMNGTGGVHVSSNVTQQSGGFWSPGVLWCADGLDTGMTTSEDCSGPCSGLLPVTLSSFEARIVEKGEVAIQWETASESNNAFFTLERADSEGDFVEIAEISSDHSGDNGARYDHLDLTPIGGINLYRLSQTDLDGRKTELGTVSVVVNQLSTLEIQAWPNPFNSHLNFNLNRPTDSEISVRVLNLSGQVLQSWQGMPEGQSVQINTQTLPPGLYLAEIRIGKGVPEVFKLIRE